MYEPTDVLLGEHRVIEKVLDAMEAGARRAMPFPFYERALDFIAHFADGCHHAKEEQGLFPALEQRGVRREQGPVGVMLHEHDEGRTHVRRMREALARKDRANLVRESLAYCALLRAHIAKEDNVLFPMGREILRQEDKERLRGEFDTVVVCDKHHASYERLAEDLLAEAQEGA